MTNKPACQNYPNRQCDYDRKCLDSRAGCWPSLVIMAALWAAPIAAGSFWPTRVEAHPATTAAGKPIGINYPTSCCKSAATSPTGDCAPIDDRYVTERSDGYHVDIPVGGHPKLKTKGYSSIIPYAKANKQPLSNDYHICLSTDGNYRFCFFPKPGAV